MQNISPGVWEAIIEPADYRDRLPALNNFQIHGDPMVFIVDMARTLGTWSLFAGLAAAVLVGISALFRRSRHPRAPLLRDIERQREQWIDLEAQYCRGEVDETTYAQTRVHLKQSLLMLMEKEARATRAEGKKDAEVESSV